MNIREIIFIVIGGGCLLWAMVLTVLHPGSLSCSYFIIAGVVLSLAPIYTRVRIEKDKEGVRFYLVTPTTKEVIEREKTRFFLRQKWLEIQEQRREKKNQSAEKQEELLRREKDLKEKEDELNRKEQNASDSDDLGCFGWIFIGLAIIGFIVVIGLVADHFKSTTETTGEASGIVENITPNEANDAGGEDD